MTRPAFLLLLLASPAWGYVRTQTSTGTPVAWRDQCPELRLGGPDNPDLPAEPYSSLVKSAYAWNGPTQSCHNPSLVVSGGHSKASDVGFDGTNVVLWRLRGFCDDPQHHSDDVCTAPNAAAVTTVFYIDKPGDARDGELLEADMEINAVDFEFATDGDPNRIDLMNTLTHELGHVLGLDHTCYTVPGSAPPTDSSGLPVPHCFPLSALSPAATQATMFNFESPGEIDKRIPTTQETSGICEIYVHRTPSCAGSGGCSMAPGAQALSLGLFLFGVLTAALSYRGLRGRR